MGRVGCALDNAAAEAFNSTLKVEYVHRHRFGTRAEARLKIATWIADFYNTTRRHSANDGLAPITFERYMIEKRQASSALLGLKGTMSEAELHLIKQRMWAGRITKARRGALSFPLPSGYVRRPSGEVVFDPDEQVRNVLRLIFAQFERIGTLHGLLRYLVQHDIRLGIRLREGPDKGILDRTRTWAPVALPRTSGGGIRWGVGGGETLSLKACRVAVPGSTRLGRMEALSSL